MDKTAIKIVNINEQPTDYNYWCSKSYAERLAALEIMRSEYNNWKYHAEQRFQRVYRITQLKSG